MEVKGPTKLKQIPSKGHAGIILYGSYRNAIFCILCHTKAVIKRWANWVLNFRTLNVEWTAYKNIAEACERLLGEQVSLQNPTDMSVSTG